MRRQSVRPARHTAPHRNTPTARRRWDKLLKRQPGSPLLWRGYLQARRSLFAAFKLSRLQAAYGDAMHALARERARRLREASSSAAGRAGAGTDMAPAVSEPQVLDVALCRLVLELVEAELAAGLSETAVARVQSLLEFHCFAPGAADRPGLGLGGFGHAGGGGGGGAMAPGQRLRLFDNFWESGAPRVGDEGAAGWAAWCVRAVMCCTACMCVRACWVGGGALGNKWEALAWPPAHLRLLSPRLSFLAACSAAPGRQAASTCRRAFNALLEGSAADV